MKTFQPIDDSVVVYEGSKTLWKQNVTLEISIVRHAIGNTLEIIVFNPQLNVELPRLYLKCDKVRYYVSDEATDIHASEKHDLFKLQFEFIVDESEIHQTVLSELINQYIVSRIEIQGYSKIFLQIQSGDNVDSATGLPDVECSRPQDLIPFVIMRNLSDIDEKNVESESPDGDRYTLLCFYAVKS
jgi:hypothetical protein